MKVNVSKVFWLLTTVELWLQGWKQEVSWTSWKFVKIILISPLGNRAYHNLCLNLLFFCFDQSLTFAIQETKVESPLKWYKRPTCPNSDSHKKALQSTFVIWFMFMWMSEYLCFKLTYLRLPIHDREKKGQIWLSGYNQGFYQIEFFFGRTASHKKYI